MSEPLFHLVAPQAWQRALAAGLYRPPSLTDEGFVHFSFAEQVAGTANLRYREEPELVVVEVDPQRLGDARLVVEDSYGSGTAFPHVYGPVPLDAAVAMHPLRRGPDGAWVFEITRGGPAGGASADR